MCNFHCWFKGCVPQWIYLAQCLAKDRLKNAVELDKVVSYTDQACFSSSAVDAHGMFIQVSGGCDKLTGQLWWVWLVLHCMGFFVNYVANRVGNCLYCTMLT